MVVTDANSAPLIIRILARDDALLPSGVCGPVASFYQAIFHYVLHSEQRDELDFGEIPSSANHRKGKSHLQPITTRGNLHIWIITSP